MILWLLLWAIYGFPKVTAWNGWALWLLVAIFMSNVLHNTASRLQKKEITMLKAMLAIHQAAERRRNRF